MTDKRFILKLSKHRGVSAGNIRVREKKYQLLKPWIN